ncbi:MAG: phytanoyl-CoA dioxygenase family protein [Hyphomonadaceae bacterium]
MPVTEAEATTLDVPLLDLPGPQPAAALFDGPRSERNFGGAAGLHQGPAFKAAELERLKAIIKAHMIETAKAVSPGAVAALEATALDAFHTVEGYDHPRMLAKRGRILPDEAVQEIKAMSFFEYVREAFGDFYLADEEDVGHEQVTFRLVRPNKQSDVGSLHRDAWFWDHYGTPCPPGVHRTKVWMGVCVDGAANGLRLAPGSHRLAAPYRVDQSGAKVAFVPDFDIARIGLRQFAGKPGDTILFNYHTLHVGSLNRADQSRVSIETTIMYRS